MSRVVHWDVCTFLCVSMYYSPLFRYPNLLYFTYSIAMLCYVTMLFLPFALPFSTLYFLFSFYLHNFTSTSTATTLPHAYPPIRPYAHTPAPRIHKLLLLLHAHPARWFTPIRQYADTSSLHPSYYTPLDYYTIHSFSSTTTLPTTLLLLYS